MDLWGMFQSMAQMYGLPFALFIGLLAWTLWTNNQREKRYIDREDRYIGVIQTLSEDVKERLTMIESEIRHLKG